jgi:DNA repair photolyase
MQKLRGALSQIQGRFEKVERSPFDDGWTPEEQAETALKTIVTEERARSIIARNDSPDIPFDQSVNPYRGCEHGCVYCYARPTHAYLELSPGLDFERRLFAKTNAVELLREELSRPGYRVAPLAFGTNTDCYQPIERRYGLMRGLIEVLAGCEHPLTIVTKSALIERDIDLLAPMAQKNLVKAFVSVTTLDAKLARTLEPRAASPARRLDTIRALAGAGIPTGVLVAPMIPALTDKTLEHVLEAAAEAGAGRAGWILLRLANEVRPLFKEWLAAHTPQRADHVISLIRQSRGGRENDPNFHSRMTGSGNFVELIVQRFELACKRFGLNRENNHMADRGGLDCTRFRPPRNSPQLGLFGRRFRGRLAK